MPVPGKETSADRDFIFGEVIYMLMEWSYHQEDGYGIKIAAYAHVALDKKYAGAIQNKDFNSNRSKSVLFDRFSDTWKENYALA